MNNKDETKLTETINDAQKMFKHYFENENLKEASIMYSFSMSQIRKYMDNNNVDMYVAAMNNFTNEEVYRITDYIKDEYWHSVCPDLKLIFIGNDFTENNKTYMEVVPEDFDSVTDLLGLTFRDNEAFNCNFYIEKDILNASYDLVASIKLKDEVKELKWRKLDKLLNELYPAGIDDDKYNKLRLFNNADYIPLNLNDTQTRQMIEQTENYLKDKEIEMER